MPQAVAHLNEAVTPKELLQRIGEEERIKLNQWRIRFLDNERSNGGEPESTEGD